MKYEFTGVTNGNLKQIRRLSDGLVGGWIESEKNLSQEGTCFVYDNAWVSGNAEVTGNAKVTGNAWVYDSAAVFDNALVFGNAWVYGNAAVTGNAKVYGDAKVFGNAMVSGKAMVSGNAKVTGNAQVSCDSILTEYNDVLNITNLKYNLTITPEWVFGGCRVFTHEEFANLTLEQCQDKSWTPNELKAYKMALELYKVNRTP